MARRLLAPAAVSSAALALVLAAPTAALADSHGHGDHGKGGNGKSSGGSSASTQSSGNGSRASSSKGDPAGNNGTIKIDYPAPADSGHANRPHPGCAFQLRMFDFDKDQYGSITFTGQAPTKLGTLLTQPHVLLSDDAAGGGQDADAVYSYTASQLGLTDQPQAKQGWHIKVAVDADNAPGGAKQKVFWLTCAPATPSGSGTAASGTSTQSGGSAAGGSGSTVTTQSVPGTTVTGGSAGGAATQAVTSGTGTLGAASVGSGETVTGFTGGSATAVTTAPRKLAAANRGSALPFTGLQLGSLLAAALGALVAGGLAIRAGRRRTAEV
jgi:hypothetical protein